MSGIHTTPEIEQKLAALKAKWEDSKKAAPRQALQAVCGLCLKAGGTLQRSKREDANGGRGWLHLSCWERRATERFRTRWLALNGGKP